MERINELDEWYKENHSSLCKQHSHGVIGTNSLRIRLATLHEAYFHKLLKVAMKPKFMPKILTEVEVNAILMQKAFEQMGLVFSELGASFKHCKVQK